MRWSLGLSATRNLATRGLQSVGWIRWILLLALSGAPALAQPELVADLDVGALLRGSSSPAFAEAGALTYFPRFRSSGTASTTELWVTGGTPAGTRLVREWASRSSLVPWRAAPLPDGRLLFVATDPATGEELWISDGSSAGTRLYADILPGPADGSPAPSSFGAGGHAGFVAWESEVLFAATTLEGVRLLAADGGASGSRLVSELPIADFAVVNGDPMLLTQGPLFDQPLQLWRSEGVPGSEVLVAQLEERFLFSFGTFRDGALLLASVDDFLDPARLYFVTTASVTLIGELALGAEVRELVSGDSLAYLQFLGEDDRCHLLRTDGSSAGTFELPAVGASSIENACYGPLFVAGDRLYFPHETDAGLEPWTSDGTPAGTLLLRDIHPHGHSEPSRFTALGGAAYFFASDAEGPALWRSDGAPAGTNLVRRFAQVDGFSVDSLGLVNGELVFSADDGDTGLEPWLSDGTAQGTRLLANLASDVRSSSPGRFLRRQSDLVFQNGAVAFGANAEAELDLYHYDGVSMDSPSRFFSTERHASTRALDLAGQTVLVSDSTNVRFGPTTVFGVAPEMVEPTALFSDSVVWQSARVGPRTLVETAFAFGSAMNGFERLWSTDGTPAGTAALLPRPQDPAVVRFPTTLHADESQVWFSYDDGVHGYELWRSDGTSAGTRLALDLVPGPDSGAAVLAVTADRLYLGSDATLVTTDRTPVVLHTMPFEDQSPFSFAVGHQGRLLFARPAPRDSPFLAQQFHLRITDGTPEGTRTLGTFTLLEGPLVASRGLTFFAASTLEHGLELWATDGSPEGTRLVADLEPGPASSSPSELRDVDGVLLFSARTAATGAEPWVTDGTPEGTRPLGDGNVGPAGSLPSGFVAVADEVVFAAERLDVGRELFGLERDPLRSPCVETEHALCLGDGRFQVEVEWLDRPSGQRGRAHALPFRADTGQFWFFEPANVELLVKVLDGTELNDHHWVFYGALSDLSYWVTVVDTWTGHVSTYTSEQGDICGVNDTRALPAGERIPTEPRATRVPSAARGEAVARSSALAPCDPEHQLCLQGGRFAVEVEWSSSQGGGSSGTGVPIPGTDDSGSFWFFDAENVELTVKVLDARTINDRFWVYFGALSDVAYTLRVIDTQNGAIREYQNAEGTICGQADVDAFAP